MPLMGIQEYIARDANYIVSIEGNIFLYPPKKRRPILLLLFIQGFVCHFTKDKKRLQHNMNMLRFLIFYIIVVINGDITIM